jgi:hypothetical protein
MNHTGNTLSGSLQLFGQPSAGGVVFPVGVGGTSNSTIPYSLPPQGQVTIRLQGASDAANVGSARITPSFGTAVPQGFAVFSYKSNLGVTVSEAILPSVIAGQAFRMYVESSKALDQVGSVRTALSLFNQSSSTASVLLELRDLDGALVAPVAAINLPKVGQVTRSVNDFFPQMPEEFRGVLWVTGGNSLIVAGLRRILNGRGEDLVTAMPAWNESILPSGSEANFAYLLTGGGYNPTFVLLSPTPTSADAGTLQLVNQDGSTTDLLQPIE